MALLTIQIFGIVIVVVSLAAIAYRFYVRSITLREFMLWALLWIVSGAFILHPNYMTSLAKAFGVGRGVDILIYLSILLLFFMMFRMNVRTEKTEQSITKLVKEIALKENKEKKK